MGLQQALQVGWRLCVATRSLLGESWTLENTDMACAYGISLSGGASPCTIPTYRNLDLHESCQQVERIARKQTNGKGLESSIESVAHRGLVP